MRQLLCWLLTAYYIILIARILLSWVPQVPDPLRPAARFVAAATDPLLTPVRGLLPPVRMGAAALDLSPIIVFVGISILQGIVC